MDGPNPSERDIKVLIHTLTYCVQFEKVTSINGKRLHISSSQENKLKYKMHDFEYEKNNFVEESSVKNIIIYHPRARFIFFYNSFSVFLEMSLVLSRNEENVVSLLV